MDTFAVRRDFVCYLHWHHDTGVSVPFYVGKGLLPRPYIKEGHNPLWVNVTKKHGYTVEIRASGLTESEAHEMEKALIKQIGRRDLGLGPLVNMTDGGEGCTGYKHDDEAKEKIGASKRGKPSKLKGRVRPSNVVQRIITGRLNGGGWRTPAPLTDEQKRRISAKLTGRKLSDETRARMSKPKSAQHAANIGKARAGKGSSLKGKPRSPEAIAAVAEGRRKARAAREAAQASRTGASGS